MTVVGTLPTPTHTHSHIPTHLGSCLVNGQQGSAVVAIATGRSTAIIIVTNCMVSLHICDSVCGVWCGWGIRLQPRTLELNNSILINYCPRSRYTDIELNLYPETRIGNPARSCNDISQDRPSGEYWIAANSTSSPVQVYCDMIRTSCSCNTACRRMDEGSQP